VKQNGNVIEKVYSITTVTMCTISIVIVHLWLQQLSNSNKFSARQHFLSSDMVVRNIN